MAFHLGFELPEPETRAFDERSDRLTRWEARIISDQIRKNSGVIENYIRRIDLFVNQERYPKGEVFIEQIRRRMVLLMDENDTFRRLLWRHVQGHPPRVKIPG